MSDKEQTYTPYFEKVEQAKEKAAQNIFNKKSRPENNLTEAQFQWAEKTIKLIEDPAFKAYLNLETNTLSQCMRLAYQPRKKVEGATHGESMMYNQGFYESILHLKAERENIWAKYLDAVRNKNQTKENGNENKKNDV